MRRTDRRPQRIDRAVQVPEGPTPAGSREADAGSGSLDVGLGPYESSYDIITGYSSERSIILP